ncbi:Vgb family protein [Hyalangium versicolor]|uniref:Vgb family protein n=1 Tax=Hyalangium versicolor TaxID=2861190 RepID=UPI001CCB8B33|nr:NHL repeat-containing protein [Hyalangium versicolor]
MRPRLIKGFVEGLAVLALLGAAGCGEPLNSSDGPPSDTTTGGNVDAVTPGTGDDVNGRGPLEFVVSSHDTSAVTEYILQPDGEVASWRYIIPPQAPMLLWPHGLAFLPDGQLIVAARGLHRVRRYDLSTGALQGEFGASTPIDTPISTIVGTRGQLFVTSLETHAVLEFNPATGRYLGSPAAPNTPELNRPGGATLGPDGLLYIANDVANTIARLDPETRRVELFAQPPQGTTPGGLTFGPDGNLYVSDQSSSRVLRFDGRTGTYQGVFVTPGSGGMRHPLTLAFGPDGALYVCSYESNAILRFDGETGAFLSSVIPPGHPSALGGPTWLLIRRATGAPR